MVNKTEYDAALAASVIAVQDQFNPSQAGNFFVVPDGYTLQDMQDLQERPNRIVASEKFVDIASLIEYLNRFADGSTLIRADYQAGIIHTILDGHLPDMPSHRSHTAGFTAQISETLKAWMAISGKSLSQIDFGSFLEDRAIDVIKPDSADVMDIVMTFDATKKVSFKSSQRLQDGQRQFAYIEENQARGAVTMPDHFIIFAPVYRGMEPQEIKFMVRYRIEDEKLRFTVQMHDSVKVLREAFDRCVDVLRAGLNDDLGLPIYVVG